MELAALASPPHGFGGGVNDGGSDDGAGGSRSSSPWLGQSAYEQIGKDEAEEAVGGLAGVGAGGPAGGWFGGWGSPQGTQKVQKRD